MRTFNINRKSVTRTKFAGLVLAGIRRGRAVEIIAIADIAPHLATERDAIAVAGFLPVFKAASELLGRRRRVWIGTVEGDTFSGLVDVHDEMDRQAGRGRYAAAMPTLDEALAAIPPGREKEMMFERHDILLTYAELVDEHGQPLYPEAAEYAASLDDEDDGYEDEDLIAIAA